MKVRQILAESRKFQSFTVSCLAILIMIFQHNQPGFEYLVILWPPHYLEIIEIKYAAIQLDMG